MPSAVCIMFIFIYHSSLGALEAIYYLNALGMIAFAVTYGIFKHRALMRQLCANPLQ